MEDQHYSRFPEAQAKIQARFDRRAELLIDPRIHYPWLMRRCRVRLLIVTDGGLDFGQGDFGLSTFVENFVSSGLWHAYFDITLGHLRNNVSDAQVMVGAPGISNSIKGFVFDNPAHFTPTMYDVVYMLGIAVNFSPGQGYTTRNANMAVYPTDRLGDAELINLSTFQDGGGGLFATGDHGSLGKAMCGWVKRARNMRYWDNTSGDNNLNEVSMNGPRRNDTNHIGHNAATEFDDQSDDIPQTIQPKLYKLGIGPFYRYTYPHPILCGPNGMIKVLPDHPHEGECIIPASLTTTFPQDGTTEYPFATGSTTYRISPEIIARSTVPAGNTAGSKAATQQHTFGAIGAYDGHRAGVGRVVTDATWHHYVNINLIGADGYPPANPKSLGFLASVSGMKHLENIKSYYKNTALWLARPSIQVCFRKRLCWKLLRHDRVIEAVASSPDIDMEKLSDRSFVYEVGAHAEIALRCCLPPCARRRFIIDIIHDATPTLARLLDPWNEEPGRGNLLQLNFVDPDALLAYALGGALMALNLDKPEATEAVALQMEQEDDSVLTRGAYLGLNWGLDALESDLAEFVAIADTANTEVRRSL
jgi:hypothetical protein